MIQSDAAFSIGKTHTICQDYAISDDPNGDFPSVWLSDGCSSSPNTDIGSRLLSHSMQSNLSDFALVISAKGEFKQNLLDSLVRLNYMRAGKPCKDLGIPKESLDATLLGLVEDDEAVYGVVYGDGALVFGNTDGTTTVYRFNYPAGYPFYPAYAIDMDRAERWEEIKDNRQTITRTVMNPDWTMKESEVYTPDEQTHLFKRDLADIRFAAVISDGIESYQARVGGETSSSFTAVPYLSVVKELVAFKNFKGEFVHRRMQAFEKECAKRGWHHNDDISVAAIYFGDTEKEG